MKSLKMHLLVLSALSLLLLNISCSKGPSTYMMGFSANMNKAVENNDFKKLEPFLGTVEDYGKLVKNLKTEKEMKKWKSLQVKSMSISFSKLMRTVKAKGASSANLVLVQMAYGAPQDPSISGDNRMIGYFSILPTGGYIVFKYFRMAGKDKEIDDGETMVISNIYYSDKKPAGKYKIIKQLCSDFSMEMFKNK